ncbi:uncharacterized protein LOC110703694 [Chenopodium quinoa]|uniref:uncharacterized protein LOC110703694 n=1 Tax=Chenopodium quinoa TaxID=63459 RepID=UPI000B7703EB|nr:uncharacterized protein LOC110703694 [Chenopodium quinoa]
MRAISEDAAEDLMNRNYKKWCRAFYTPLSCCDSVDNNMSEVFNAYILNSRHKPIITMLEDIREGVMERLHKKRDQIANKEMVLCPRIQQKLETCKVWARGWNAYWDGGFCYGVREGATREKFVVNLSQRTCSCRAWQISGIPCKHVVVVVWNKSDHPEPYVNEYFTKSTYLKAYQHLLEPLNGPQEWPLSNDLVLPPKLKKINHRPKTKRRMLAAEVTAVGKLKRKGGVITCRLCGVQGHNARGCKNVAAGDRSNINTRNTENSTSATTATHEPQLPMHMREVGIYTYPNGFQRVVTARNLQI